MHAFISYRREGGADTARVIRGELALRNVQTFLDVDDLGSHYFDERLLREIESAANFILILSPGCLDRCHNEGDWLRREIVHAMRTGRNIIPILKDRFEFPSIASLPPEIADLPRYNCVEYSHTYMEAAISKLIRFLKLEGSLGPLELGSGLSETSAAHTQSGPLSLQPEAPAVGAIPVDQAMVQRNAMHGVDSVTSGVKVTASPFVSADLIGELRRLVGHTRSVRSVSVSSDGKRAASGGLDHSIRLWDIDTGTAINCITGHGAGVLAVAVSGDASQVLAGDGAGGVRLWDAATGSEIRRFDGHKYSVFSVDLSGDGRRALSGGWDGVLRLWNVATGTLEREFPGHSDEIRRVAFSPAGGQIASCAQDHSIRIWDTESGNQLACYLGHEGPVTSLALSSDGRRALSGGHDRHLRLWNTEAGSEITRFQGHTGRVTSVALSADATHALSGSLDGTVRLWNVEQGVEVHCFRGHFGSVYSVAFQAGTGHALSAGSDKTIRIWSLPIIERPTAAIRDGISSQIHGQDYR
jgi:hypothetical protein